MIALLWFVPPVTVARNRDYRSAASISTVTLAEAPDNYRAHEYFGHRYSRQPGKELEAIEHCSAAQRLRPYSVPAHLHLALLLAEVSGRTGDVLAHYEAELRLNPDYPDAHNNLVVILARLLGRLTDGLTQVQSAVGLKPDFAAAYANLGDILAWIPGSYPRPLLSMKNVWNLARMIVALTTD